MLFFLNTHLAQNLRIRRRLFQFLIFITIAGGLAAKGEKHNTNTKTQEDIQEIIEMETVEVAALRARWQYARTKYFEILTTVPDKKYINSIINEAEALIDWIRTKSHLFIPDTEMPILLILGDESVWERFLATPSKRDKQLAKKYERFSEYSSDNKNTVLSNGNQASNPAKENLSDGYDTSERIIINMFLANINDKQIKPGRDRAYPTAMQLLQRYMYRCMRRHGAIYGNTPWFYEAIMYMERFSYRENGHLVLPRTYWAHQILHYGFVPGFADQNGKIDYEKLRNDLAKQPKGPFLNFSEFFSYRPVPFEHITRNDKHTLESQYWYLTWLRQSLDFIWYCLLGPDVELRAGFALLIKHTRSESLTPQMFKNYFGKNYEDLHAEMYKFYRNLTSTDAESKTLDYFYWGPKVIKIYKFDQTKKYEKLTFNDSNKSITGRMLGEWYSIVGEEDLAKGLFERAYKDDNVAKRDPEFLASYGLTELSARNKQKAVELLEKAVAEKIDRPGVYRAVSKLRLENILKNKATGDKLSTEETNQVAGPLMISVAGNRRLNHEHYRQFSEIWKLTDVVPSNSQLAVIMLGCQQFPDNLDLLELSIPLLAKYGQAAIAKELLSKSEKEFFLDGEKARLNKLREITHDALKR